MMPYTADHNQSSHPISPSRRPAGTLGRHNVCRKASGSCPNKQRKQEACVASSFSRTIEVPAIVVRVGKKPTRLNPPVAPLGKSLHIMAQALVRLNITKVRGFVSYWIREPRLDPSPPATLICRVLHCTEEKEDGCAVCVVAVQCSEG